MNEHTSGDVSGLQRPGRRRWLSALGALALAVGLSGCATPRSDTDAGISIPRNIIILFADGTTFSQWSFGQYSSRVLRQQSFAVTDVVLREGVSGMLSTSPADAYVTDSAAAASAMSTGFKVNNGAISITPDGRPQRTLMQSAKSAGKRIGMVTTAQIYDATPAAFSVNAPSRRDYQAIVDRFAELEPDVLMGGGADFFVPQGQPGGKRKDGKDVIAQFRGKGHGVARNAGELKAADGAKLLGLFAEEEMGFELDRATHQQPSVAEMTTAALKALSQTNAKGFVLLVENENTDAAGHANDAAALMHALWAFDDAVKVALEFQRRNPDTLVVVTGDHETGGFSATYALKDLSSISSSNRFYSGDDTLRMLASNTMSFTAASQKLGRKPSTDQLAAVAAEGFPRFCRRAGADPRPQDE